MTELQLPAGYSPTFSAEDKQFLDAWMKRMRHTHVATAPLLCRGKECPIIHTCPLHRLNKALPIGKTCPVEQGLLDMWEKDLTSELGIQETDYVDQAQVAEYLELRLLTKRAREGLATQDLLIDAIRGVDKETGEVLIEKKLNPLLTLFERLAKAKDRILETLIATRDAKSKDKSRKSVSAADVAAALFHQVQLVKSEEEARRITAVDVDYIDLDPTRPARKTEKLRLNSEAV